MSLKTSVESKNELRLQTSVKSKNEPWVEKRAASWRTSLGLKNELRSKYERRVEEWVWARALQGAANQIEYASDGTRGCRYHFCHSLSGTAKFSWQITNTRSRISLSTVLLLQCRLFRVHSQTSASSKSRKSYQDKPNMDRLALRIFFRLAGMRDERTMWVRPTDVSDQIQSNYSSAHAGP
jgi:hypothetical protein